MYKANKESWDCNTTRSETGLTYRQKNTIDDDGDDEEAEDGDG